MIKFISIFLFVGLLVSCDKDDDVYSLGNALSINLDSIIKITVVSKLQLESDSVSRSKIQIKLYSEADSAYRHVRIITTNGQFLNGRKTDTIVVNQSGIAELYILSSTEGEANIKFSTGSIIVDTTILFIKSLPDDMILTSDLYVANTTQTVTLTANLFRNAGRGIVNDNEKVWFVISPQDPLQPLIFTPFTFSESKKAQITIANPFSATGQFTIEAKTVSAAGDTIRRFVPLTIQ